MIIDEKALKIANERIAYIQERLEELNNTDEAFRQAAFPYVENTIEAFEKKLKDWRHERILIKLNK
jgi:hypothetical protein